MSFFNPFSQKPDIGGGMGDIMSQIMQMMMMKKMGGGQGGPPQQVPTPMPQQGGVGRAGGMANIDRLMGGASQAAGQMNPSLGGQGGMDPNMLKQMMSDPATAMKLRQMLQQIGISL